MRIYDLGLNNSSLTIDQISEYCTNQILETENVETGLTIVGFWYNYHSNRLDNHGNRQHMAYSKKKRKNRRLSGLSKEKMDNREDEEEEQITAIIFLILISVIHLINLILKAFKFT